MDFPELVGRRRMVRRYDPTVDVPRETVAELLALAVQAPSAGLSQGWGFLVLDSPTDRTRYWDLTARDPGAPDRWLEGMRTAPVVVLALSDPAAYARRYARADKARSPLSTTSSTADPDAADGSPGWPVAWWDADTAMACLLLLLGATDRGLGGCLAGIPADRWEAVRDAFGIPTTLRPVGLVTLGVPADGADGGRGRSRRPADQVVRWGRWEPVGP